MRILQPPQSGPAKALGRDTIQVKAGGRTKKPNIPPPRRWTT